MTFDEQFHRAFETVNDRLQDVVARLMSEIVGDLTSAAKADRATAALEARTSAARESADRLAAALVEAEADKVEEGKRQREEGRTEGHSEGRGEARREALEEALRIRDEGIRVGREEGLKHGREEGRREGLKAGRIEGQQQAARLSHDALDEAVAATRAELLAAELAASQRLLDAVRSLGRARSLGEVLDTLVGCAAREAPRVAVLLMRGERFFGWRFVGFGSSLDPAGHIEFGSGEAGVVEQAARKGMAAGGADAPAFAALPAGRDGLAVPVAIDGHMVAVLYVDQGDAEPETIAWSDTLEILACHAGRCLESLMAFKAARAAVEHAGKPSIPGADGPSARGSGSSRINDDPTAAQRYARLLVSEIKLYHEAEVVAGRRERDLMMRLGGEIARARVLYERRVPTHVRDVADHFHAELVRTLANGDESLLELKM